MCGIIAIAGKNAGKIPDEKVGAMLACLAKRGPDDRGFDRIGQTGPNGASAILGQTRLAIVDLSPAGHQPMHDNRDPLTLVFNGEIYGYKEVRAELERRGHRFSSHSDTEVILKAYAEYGRDCVNHLDGQFAFALWDDNKKELFVARDRFGKKPFYYAFAGGEREASSRTFVAASEMKSIFATGLIKGKIDALALDEYLRLSYVPSYHTIYSNISMLPPAHAGVVKNGAIEIWRYWDLEKKKLDVTYDEAKATIKELFDQAVKKRMVADVEVGSLLSGGVDSTIVTLYAQKYSTFPMKTFAVGYDGHKNELPYALEASEKIGTDHRTLAVSADLASELGSIIEYMDEPHSDSSNFPQHLISNLASSQVKVALTGDGADELFMGYGWYQKKWHMPRWRLDWRLLTPFQGQQKAVTVFRSGERRSLLKGFRGARSAYEKSLRTANDFDLKFYLPGQLLSKIDRTSMMHSLEIRSPFLDTALAEFVYSLPEKFKLSKTQNKIILKDILAEVFPKEFVYRKKQGFGAPINEWLRQDTMKALVDSLFAESNPAWKYVSRGAALKTKFAFEASDRRNSANKLWNIVCLLMWFEKHSHEHE